MNANDTTRTNAARAAFNATQPGLPWGDLRAWEAVVQAVDASRPQDPEPERTPETVLRAMVLAYTIAETDAHVLVRTRGYSDDYRSAARFYACRGECMCAIAEIARNGAPRPLSQPGLQADYNARLAGTRPLNAPPLEV